MRVEKPITARTPMRADAAGKLPLDQNPGRSEQAVATRRFGLDGDMQRLAEVPFDSERVQAVRKAIDQGKYPLNPSKIADAIIAASYFLRKPL